MHVLNTLQFIKKKCLTEVWIQFRRKLKKIGSYPSISCGHYVKKSKLNVFSLTYIYMHVKIICYTVRIVNYQNPSLKKPHIIWIITKVHLYLDSVAFEGRLLVIGFASGDIPQMKTNSLLLKSASAVGFYWGNYGARGHPFFIQSIQDVTRFLAEGKINPYISDMFPLEKVSVSDTNILLYHKRKRCKD